ncbi:MAG: polysaccharide pyruvyl transferase CsaB [Ruminococcaceae bacterium]|nr:polysaccharide pyruvyl transferase CsaB [Oscillospiraceae bacterium]
MNIMHMISGGDSGGAKTHLFNLLDKLKEMCDVVVVCLMRGVFYNEILEKDIETLLFEQRNRFDLSVVRGIRRTIEERKIDLLHVHGARANFIAMFLKKHLSIPIVTTMHSDYLLDFDSFFKKLFFTNLNSYSLKRLDYFIAVSDSFKEMLIDREFMPNNIHTVYNGMDYSTLPQNVTSKEDFAKKYNLEMSDELVYVGIAARFDIVKGVDTFIRGAALAYKKNKNLRFLIAGSGVEENNLKSLCASYGMDGIIKFLGFVTDMYGFLNFININSLTSHCESFPYSMLEGAAMKRPMIASAVGGIPALVEDGVTGYLFESKNEEDFAEKLVFMASDKEKLADMGNNIYEKVTTKFSSDVLANDHMSIYKSIIADYKRPKRYDFVLSGYYGFNNSGDDALLLALIGDLKRVKPDAKLAVLSSDPLHTRKMYRVDAYSRVSPCKLKKLFEKSSVLLSGGGSLIQDETSSKSLWYYLYIIAFAKRCKMKVMQIASGIGPVNKKFNRSLTARVLNDNVDRITLREEKSYGEIKAMNITVPAEVTADPAISLVGEERGRIEEIFEANSIPFGNYICVALRKWKYAMPDFEENVAKALDNVSQKHGKDIVFLPMQYPVDTEIAASVAAKMKSKSHIITTPLSIKEAIGVISCSSIVVAMRLHSLVYAVANGVGVVAIKYDPKIEGFMEYFRQKYIVDIFDLDSKKLGDMIDSCCKESKNLSDDGLCDEMKRKAHKNAFLAVELLENEND